jgi:hypothetical protein
MVVEVLEYRAFKIIFNGPALISGALTRVGYVGLGLGSVY